MTENQLLYAVLETAATFKWLAIHHRPARTGDSWRTATQGNGAKGFPDVVLVRNAVVFVELKSSKGKLSPEQEVWRSALWDAELSGTNIAYVVWRPADWTSGRIEAILR